MSSFGGVCVFVFMLGDHFNNVTYIILIIFLKPQILFMGVDCTGMCTRVMGSFTMHNVLHMCIGKNKCKLMPVEMYKKVIVESKINSIYISRSTC